MGFLNTLRGYWAANSTLNTAIPSTQLFLEFVPPGISFPYARISVLGSVPSYMTSSTHIETVTYQLSIYDTDSDNLDVLGSTIMGVLDNAYLTATTLINTRTNRIPMAEVVNGVYTYSLNITYEWSYNSLSS